MHVVISGATGFVGIGVLHESLNSALVGRVTVIGRSSTGVEHPKLRELLVDDMGDLAPIADELTGVDACFWCLGTSSGGMDEATYTRITHTFAMHAAETLRAQNPDIRFCFLSGSGVDGGAMWARVKKRTEDDLRALGFAGLTVFRPAYIKGLHGAELRGALYKVAYALFSLLSPLIRLFGGGTSNAEIGQAMIVAARDGLDGDTLDSGRINEVAARL